MVDPTKTIVLRDLPASEKENYFKFLIDHNVQFGRDDNGNYVATIRVVRDVSISTQLSSNVAADSDDKGGVYERPIATNALVSRREVSASTQRQHREGQPKDVSLARYPRLLVLVKARATLRPKRKTAGALIRVIEEIYESRYARDLVQLKSESNPPGTNLPKQPQTFSSFVYDFFSKRYGLTRLVEQSVLDLLYSIEWHRGELLEAELMSQFLTEAFDTDDLLFFLYVRSIVCKELGVVLVPPPPNQRQSHTRMSSPRLISRETDDSRGIFLTSTACSLVIRALFGPDQEAMQHKFCRMVELHIDRVGREDRRINLTQFLFLTLHEYHQTRPDANHAEPPLALSSPSPSHMPTPHSMVSTSTSPMHQPEFTEHPVDDHATNIDRYLESIRKYKAAMGEAHSEHATNGHGRQVHTDEGDVLQKSIQVEMNSCMESYVDALLQEHSFALPQHTCDELRVQVMAHLVDKVNSLLRALFQHDKRSWLETLVISMPSETQLRHVESIQMMYRKLQASDPYHLPPANVANICRAVLKTPELVRDLERLTQFLVNYVMMRLHESRIVQQDAQYDRFVGGDLIEPRGGSMFGHVVPRTMTGDLRSDAREIL
eukprot:GILK01007603.1.p1 GENE.GILK01007603.1~~GILK01007603.1.p1  ORF type:complete len:604 (+),score=56.26 GILK01007603.1:129-1940(+)